MDRIAVARAVLDNEIAGLQALRDTLDGAFEALVDLCLSALAADGKLVLCGVGKSGHIGHKIAATLSSTGSRAAFLHPVEAMHGDLGVLHGSDVFLALSYSGETDELLQVLPAVKRFEVPIVAVTGVPDSSLARWADLVVPMAVPSEACPFNLAPTTSSTVLLALGDALAIVLMEAKGFRMEDYGRLHPAGAIGRSVTLRVRDVMRPPERTPVVPPEMLVKDALMQMTRMRAGSVLVADPQRRLLGIFTDGDFRRHAQVDLTVLEQPIRSVMTPDPIHLRDDEMAIAILKLLERREIDDIPVVSAAGELLGAVDIQDLPKFKLL